VICRNLDDGLMYHVRNADGAYLESWERYDHGDVVVWTDDGSQALTFSSEMVAASCAASTGGRAEVWFWGEDVG
jgi:hypothetical protein